MIERTLLLLHKQKSSGCGDCGFLLKNVLTAHGPGMRHLQEGSKSLARKERSGHNPLNTAYKTGSRGNSLACSESRAEQDD